jgi:dUTP pyrophosphatase
MTVKIVNKSSFPLPNYETSGSSGLDVRAHLSHAIELAAGERALIPTGLYLEIPKGVECQVRPRSGLALKKGITVVNSPGTVDADYRGEVGVILINHSFETVLIAPGERIAQLVFCPIIQITWNEETTLNSSERGAGGFGSTGVN